MTSVNFCDVGNRTLLNDFRSSVLEERTPSTNLMKEAASSPETSVPIY